MFLRSNKLEQLELWKNLLGFRNQQEKLEKILAYWNVVEKFISQKGHNPFHGDLVHHPGLF